MKLTDLFTSIADSIRAKDSSTSKIKATDFPDRIKSIPSGADVSFKPWFDECYSDGHYFYQQAKLTYDTLNSILNYNCTSNVIDMRYMFYNCISLTTIPQIDTSNVSNMQEMFHYCISLTTIPQLDTSKVNNMINTFSYCSSLAIVPQLDLSNVDDMTNMLILCSSLTEFHATGMKVSFDLQWSTKLEREALLEIFGNLATVTTTQTLTLGSTLLAKLTDDDKAIATNKGWTLA